MVLLNFSFTGENSTGAQAFTLIKEYKFKTCLLKDIKYTIAGEDFLNRLVLLHLRMVNLLFLQLFHHLLL